MYQQPPCPQQTWSGPDPLFLRPPFSQLTLGNDPAQTLTHRQSRHTQPSTTAGSRTTFSIPSQPIHGSQQSHRLAAPNPQCPGLPVSFRAVQQLRPTFSPHPAMPVSRQNSMPVVPSDPRHADAHHTRCSSSTIPNLPQFAKEPGTVLSPLIGTMSALPESSESSTSASTNLATRSPPPLFTLPRYGRSPSSSLWHRRLRPVSRSSSSLSSSDSDDGSPRRIYLSLSDSLSQSAQHLQ
jgi:hypothetical protein